MMAAEMIERRRCIARHMREIRTRIQDVQKEQPKLETTQSQWNQLVRQSCRPDLAPEKPDTADWLGIFKADLAEYPEYVAFGMERNRNGESWSQRILVKRKDGGLIDFDDEEEIERFVCWGLGCRYHYGGPGRGFSEEPCWYVGTYSLLVHWRGGLDI